MKSFDLVVIGGGPGGYPAAIRAAQLGLKTALIDKNDLGGACLHRGCIPSKAYIAAAEMVAMARRGEKIGIRFAPPEIDYEKLVQVKDQKVTKLKGGIAGLLKGNKVEVFTGEGRLEGAGLILAGTETLQAKNIIVATGSEPVRPALFPFGEKVVTTDELFQTSLPRRLLVVGGGVIGCELASAYNLLGSTVTLVELLPDLLPQEGGNVSRTVRTIFEQRGISLKTGLKVEKVETGETVRSTLSNGEVVETDLILVAIGRRGGEDRLGLSQAGVAVENGFIKVNDRMQTSVPGIYAVGDRVGTTMLAHGATAEGLCAVENIVGNQSTMNYQAIPRVTYTIPEIASVGLREADLRRGEPAARPYKVGRFSYLANGMAMLHEEAEGYAEIYVGDDQKVLGATVMGAHAADLIQEVALIIRNNLSIEALIETVHAHPTFTEIIHEAAEDSQGRAIHKLGRKSV